MAVPRLSLLVVLATILFPAIAMATEHIVGDEQGWRAGVDYQAWASRKVFFMGDTLVFNYAGGQDHVFSVTGPAFESCTFPSVGLSSGHDIITLATPGRKWFIGDHCSLGQKLVFTVLPGRRLPSPLPRLPGPVPTPAPAPAPARPPRSGREPNRLLSIFH